MVGETFFDVALLRLSKLKNTIISCSASLLQTVDVILWVAASAKINPLRQPSLFISSEAMK